MPDSIWWRCGGSSDQLPELAICDVLATTPEAAAIEYATGAHQELAPDEARIVVDVTVYPLDYQSDYSPPELEARGYQRVTSERRYVGSAEVVDHG